MTVFLFFVGIAQCAIVWLLGQVGKGLLNKAKKERHLAAYAPPTGWPRCAMIIPVSGRHPYMENALRSLLNQNYPDFSVRVVTATADDAAMGVINHLQHDFPTLQHVVAGESTSCGQKNHNLLGGIASVGEDCEIYVFCDSTHLAQPDFLRCLVGPIARHHAPFSTGYHEVEPLDNGIIGLAYALSVLAMRFMQALAAFTQPWGGALAMSREAFNHFQVARLWEDNVVDDCSLAWWLQKEGAHVALCPGALLLTPVRAHPMSSWRAWLTRQILFLKFCLPGQWVLLGFFCVLMIVPTLWCAWAVLRGILDIGGNMAPFLALCWGCLAVWAIRGWRQFLPHPPSGTKWVWAFFCACAMFCIAYLGTLWTRRITWRNITYKVGSRGTVKKILRH